jgi:cytochrome c oxidase cbb3-type subunit 1
MGESVIPRSFEGQQKLRHQSPVTSAAWHGLAWLVVANLIGVWLAILLLVPSAGGWLGELTYGRWMPVHLNFQLYGWLSLPLVAWLLKVYRADVPPIAAWSRAALTVWSLALILGAASWLSGHSSGKLFLDWTGYTRVYFPLAIFLLWLVLLCAFLRSWRSHTEALRLRLAKLAGLAILLLVPFAIYAAANPAIYPPVNPDSGGPTGASQLESVLVIVLILFVLPYGLGERKLAGKQWIRASWIVFAIEALLCLGLGRADVSHHRPTQFFSLGSLLIWVPLIPAYYNGFAWESRTRPWRIAVLFWWALLIPTGWCLFLPGILDHLKFTDGLVSHSLLAMAGFVTSLLLLVLIVLLGKDGDVFDSQWAFVAWNAGTLVYVIIMLYAGWIEGYDPAFTMVPSTTRTVIYTLRLLCGFAMFAASANWLLSLSRRMRLRQHTVTERTGPRAHGRWRDFGGKPDMSKRLLKLYQLLAGLSDTSTGVLLIFAPAWTLHLMGVSAPPLPIAFASFVGAFVLSVGLSYFLVPASHPLSANGRASWKAQWQVTALVRSSVALVLLSEIALGRMEPVWIMVAITDGLLAAIQWLGLSRGWLSHAE